MPDGPSSAARGHGSHARRGHPRAETPADWLHDEWVIVDRDSGLAEDLVRLRVHSVAEVQAEVSRMSELLLSVHPERVHRALEGAARCPACAEHVRRLRADHERFETSAEQLRWFWSIVERDDHGGNRQALGQYWKILLEALARHLSEERVIGVHESSSRAKGTPSSRPVATPSAPSFRPGDRQGRN